jgi:uncharacterized protein (DUF2342 family)
MNADELKSLTTDALDKLAALAIAHERWADYKKRKALENEMPLTREFKETLQARIRADRKYSKEPSEKASSVFSRASSRPESGFFATTSTRRSGSRS